MDESLKEQRAEYALAIAADIRRVGRGTYPYNTSAVRRPTECLNEMVTTLREKTASDPKFKDIDAKLENIQTLIKNHKINDVNLIAHSKALDATNKIFPNMSNYQVLAAELEINLPQDLTFDGVVKAFDRTGMKKLIDGGKFDAATLHAVIDAAVAKQVIKSESSKVAIQTSPKTSGLADEILRQADAAVRSSKGALQLLDPKLGLSPKGKERAA